MISKRYFWNPHRTQKMSPFGRVCLLERAIGVGAEDAGLRIEVNQHPTKIIWNNLQVYLGQSTDTFCKATAPPE
jgi:hypothetical protein